MEKLLETSVVIKGLVFSAQDIYGPTAIYQFPAPVDEDEAKALKKENIIKLTHRDYIQISIKNLSMIISDLTYKDYKTDYLNFPYFGIIPYPDFRLTSLTFYHFIEANFLEKPIISAFSILVDENQRSFLYNNLDRLKSLIISFFYKFDSEIEYGYKQIHEMEPIFCDLLQRLIEIEKKPYSSITSKTKTKLLLLGTENSGKTSFLYSVTKKFSKLIGLSPTAGAEIKSIEALGSSIFIWDLGGQSGLREKYLNKAEIYLYDADLLFYFIDVKNKSGFEESLEYLQNILIQLKRFNQNPPIVYIFSKGDPDILKSKEIIENINYLQSRLSKIVPETVPEIFVTSIFSIFSILRAFSSGISKLSPNKELINLNLKNFSTRTGIYLSLLLNNEGLVLADYYSPEALIITDIPKKEELSNDDNLRNIFEITAPQFAMLYKIFSKFKALQKEEAIFKIANSVILLKKTQIADFDMFILFLMDEEGKKERINELIPDFLYRTSDLLLRYIS